MTSRHLLPPRPRLLSLLSAASDLASLSCATEPGAIFHANSAHSGVYDSVAPGNLSIKWTFQTGEAILSSPTVANGTVYVGSSDNFLYAVDAATGKQKWKFDAHGNVSSSPAVNGKTDFFVSLNRKLYAVDDDTGMPLWAFATKGGHRHTAAGMEYLAPATEVTPDQWDFFLSSPAIHDGEVYCGSVDGTLYALGNQRDPTKPAVHE